MLTPQIIYKETDEALDRRSFLNRKADQEQARNLKTASIGPSNV